MIAVDGGNYDKEGKIFPQIIEKLGLGFKICNSSIRICRATSRVQAIRLKHVGSLLT